MAEFPPKPRWQFSLRLALVVVAWLAINAAIVRAVLVSEYFSGSIGLVVLELLAVANCYILLTAIFGMGMPE